MGPPALDGIPTAKVPQAIDKVQRSFSLKHDSENIHGGSCLAAATLGFGDPLPFCGLLKLLDVSNPALNTLANCLHSIATIRDQ